MVIQGNLFELLGHDDGDDLENLISRAAAVKIEEPPSVVEKRPYNTQKPMASSQSPPQFHTKPQRSFDRARSERIGNNVYGSERPHRNAMARYNDHENGSQQNNGGVSGFRRNNGFRLENEQGDGLKRYERRATGFRKDEGETEVNVRPYIRRPNPHRQNYDKQHKEVESAGYEVDDSLQAPSQGNRFGRERGFGRSRGYNNGSEVVVIEDKQQKESQGQKGDSTENFPSMNKSNDYKDERRYRSRNWNSGGGDNIGFHRGYENGGSDERRGTWVRRGFKDENALEEKNDESKDLLRVKGESGVEGDAVAAEDSKESDSKKGKREEVLSQEEAEKLAEEEAEAKRLTLKEYEKQLQEKRNPLESMKTEERKVKPDKDFESMQIVAKKNEESIFVKLSNDSDKLKKKKITAEKDNNAHKLLVPNFKPGGANYPGRRGGRYPDHGGYGDGYSRRMKKEAPPSFEDSKQFPALGGGSRKA